ncbi:hypothetical protein SHIRM173S_10102 [Streptomyces hirsutus]
MVPVPAMLRHYGYGVTAAVTVEARAYLIKSWYVADGRRIALAYLVEDNPSAEPPCTKTIAGLSAMETVPFQRSRRYAWSTWLSRPYLSASIPPMADAPSPTTRCTPFWSQKPGEPGTA